ncbi:VOC family protein [Confluentibacter sediminis]|uniref:VOC family protein n=1 Tax=Confluentibacter sediminis TaxID=2219045 RepID=UPI000DACEB8E|nr:VOC family protein [Confluentibacter sediminis]
MENETFNPVGWFEIYVNNMQRATSFYETILQTKLEELPTPSEDTTYQMYSFPSNMTSYGSGGTLVKMEGFNAGGNSTIIYFVSEDCSIEEARIVDAGGKIFKPKMSIGEYGFIVLATDTEGNMFGIHSLK